MFTLYSSNSLQDATNCFYLTVVQINDNASLQSAVSRDYVAAKYKDRRSIANFIQSDVIIMDCDNSHSDNYADWVTPNDIEKTFPDVSFAVHYSRNHMKEKDGKLPRPKFHVFFPIDIITNAEIYKTTKEQVAEIFPYFDRKALDAGRFFFGTENPQVEIFNSAKNLTQFLNEYNSLHSNVTEIKEAAAPTEKVDIEMTENVNNSQVIPEGTRNTTMFNYAEKILKLKGNTDETYKFFIEKSKQCVPLLDDDELQRIWSNAVNFYEGTIATQKDYIPPDEFNNVLFSLEPSDYSDLGQAEIFVKEYKNTLRYSEATGFITHNGSYWKEDNLQAQSLIQLLTDSQYKEAKMEMKKAQQELKNCGALSILTQLGETKARSSLTTDKQKRAYNYYMHVRKYENFIKERRTSYNIGAVLNEIKPKLKIDVEMLDTHEFLLNTPNGTIDLRSGEMTAHNPEHFITKQTAVSPNYENQQLWLDAVNTFFCSDTELINYVQEIVGLAAIGKVFVEALIIAYGNGKNGKSTFWNTISKVLGMYSGNLSADTLTLGCKRNVKPEMAEARGKRLLIAAELQENTKLDTSVVKNLCSTDDIFAEKKYKAPFSFKPSHSLVLYTNNLPTVGTNDYGTWRRLLLIPFNAIIQDNQDIKNYSDFLFKNAGSAVLQWIIDGAKRIITKEFKLKQPQIVKDAINNYKKDNDWFQIFLDECCEIGEKYLVQSSEFYNAYRLYCQDNNETAHSTKDFYYAVERAGFTNKKVGRQCKMIFGLQIAHKN